MYPKITWKIIDVHKLYSSQKLMFSRDAPPCSYAVLCLFLTMIHRNMLITFSRSLSFIQVHDSWFGSVSIQNSPQSYSETPKNEGRAFLWNVGTNLYYKV